MSAPLAHQPLPQQRSSRAGLQLPTALPCPATDPRPHLIPREVPDAQGCPSVPLLPGSWLGVGRAMATRPCHHPPWDSLGSQPLQGPDKFLQVSAEGMESFYLTMRLFAFKCYVGHHRESAVNSRQIQSVLFSGVQNCIFQNRGWPVTFAINHTNVRCCCAPAGTGVKS